MISGIPLVLGLGTRMSDPYVYVVFSAPSIKNDLSLTSLCELPSPHAEACFKVYIPSGCPETSTKTVLLMIEILHHLVYVYTTILPDLLWC